MAGPPHIVRMLLEVDPVAEPIAGRVGIEGTASRRFGGWVELSGAIEALRIAAGAAAEVEPAPPEATTTPRSRPSPPDP